MRRLITKDIYKKALRHRKSGKSYKEIHDLLNISKSTAFEWTRNVKLDLKAQTRINAVIDDARYRSGFTRHISKQNQIVQIYDSEEKEFNQNTKKIINKNKYIQRLLCSLIYWCEGAKADTTLKFINSDPKLIGLFLFLLRSSYPIDESKFRVMLHLHEYHSVNKQKEYWSKLTGISKNQFYKSYIKPHSGKIIRIGYPGCICINYHDSIIARRLLALAKISMGSARGAGESPKLASEGSSPSLPANLKHSTRGGMF